MARPRPSGGTRAMSGPPGVLRFWNRRVTILRGTTADEFGDESDVGVPYLTGVPCALAEESHQTSDLTSAVQQTIRTVTCIMPNWAGPQADDTIFDPATGNFYEIESLQVQPGPGYYPPAYVLTLRMRSGVTPASD